MDDASSSSTHVKGAIQASAPDPGLITLNPRTEHHHTAPLAIHLSAVAPRVIAIAGRCAACLPFPFLPLNHAAGGVKVQTSSCIIPALTWGTM